METQLNRGLARRLMYIESKGDKIDGANGRIGWVTFSKTGKTMYYRGREFSKAKGIRGNFFDVSTGQEFWVSGVKKRGSNVHPAERGVSVSIDDDAQAAYDALKST